MKKQTWVKCADRLPPNKMIVETKIDDERGARNITTLRRVGNLWFTVGYTPTMYVYYTPTHWRKFVSEPNRNLSAICQPE